MGSLGVRFANSRERRTDCVGSLGFRLANSRERPGIPMDDRPDVETEAEEETWPIGFMIIIALAALYLGWRLIQAIAWVVEKI